MEKKSIENPFDVPLQADELIKLAEKIIECHILSGYNSPIKADQIAVINYKAGYAKSKHEEGVKYKKLMDEAWAERDFVLGLLEGSSKGLKFTLAQLQYVLEKFYEGKKEELLKWGFHYRLEEKS